jgi:hypothetical protein
MSANPLGEAYGLARKHNLRITTKRNSAGDIIYWCVFRMMTDRHVLVGKRVSQRSLLALVQDLTSTVSTT